MNYDVHPANPPLHPPTHVATNAEASRSVVLTRNDRRKRKNAAKAQQPTFRISTTPDRHSTTSQQTPHKHEQDNNEVPVFTPVASTSSGPARNNKKPLVVLGTGGPTVGVARTMGASAAAAGGSSWNARQNSSRAVERTVERAVESSGASASVARKRKAESVEQEQAVVTPKPSGRRGDSAQDAAVAALVAGGTPLLEALESVKKKKRKKKKNTDNTPQQQQAKSAKSTPSSGLSAFLSGI
jgi:hypothetical protein